MFRSVLAALATTAALLGATSAQAGTHWSVGISLPATGVVVSNGGYYAPPPAPVYYEPAPVYVPAPRYVERDVYYAPPPPRVVYAPVYRERRWDDRWDHRWEHEHRDHWDRGDRWDHGRDDYGPRRGR
jgi:hypothetical protein